MASASVISNSLKNLSTFLQDHQVSFSNGLLILFTIGGEQIFRFNAFRCPCNHDEAFNYALIFLFAPALILGIIGVAVSNLTWRILHGCQRRTKKAANGCCKTAKYLFIATARAAVVPFAWLFIAMLDGNYYACMMAKNPCEKVSDGRTERETEEILHLKSVSQNVAWIGLAALILVSFIVICFVRCFDGVTYVQYKYLNSYTEVEQVMMDKCIQESTKTLAKSNVEKFISKELELKKTDWDKISKIPDYTLSEECKDEVKKEKYEDEGDNEKREGQASPVAVKFLTPLHKWIHEQPQEIRDQEDNKQTQEVSQVIVQVGDTS